VVSVWPNYCWINSALKPKKKDEFRNKEQGAVSENATLKSSYRLLVSAGLAVCDPISSKIISKVSGVLADNNDAQYHIKQ
jgi:hypothetical protein